MTAPSYRAVEQQTGDTSPWLAIARDMTAQRDQAIRERDDARAERDNMVNLAIEVGRLGNYLRHAIADRDNFRESADEWRDKYDAAQVRMDELAAELNAAKASIR